MTEIMNLANVILILGSIWFYFNYEKSLWFIGFILFALFVWSYHAYTNERKALLKAEIELVKAKIEYYRRKKP